MALIGAFLSLLREKHFLLVRRVESTSCLGGTLTFQTNQNIRVNPIGQVRYLANGLHIRKADSSNSMLKRWEE